MCLLLSNYKRELINLKVYSILFLAPFGILNKGTDNEHFFNNSKINIKITKNQADKKRIRIRLHILG